MVALNAALHVAYAADDLAAEGGVPVIPDAGGEELRHAVSHGPDLVVTSCPGQLLGWS